MAWLRSEENHILEVPPGVARQYDERVRRLLGYTTHGAGHDQLGYYGGNDPVWVQQNEAEAAARGQLPGNLHLQRPLLAEFRQKRLRDAAEAGFAEAQFELAWAIIRGQQGAAGTGADGVSAGQLLLESADQLPRSESELAIREYSGCIGITPDVNSALTHACEAAQRGVIDAVIGIAPHLSQSQIDPDEVSAWGLVEASLEQQECAGYTGISFQWMKSVISRLNSPTITSNAEALANQYWQEYGAQMLRNSGCVT